MDGDEKTSGVAYYIICRFVKRNMPKRGFVVERKLDWKNEDVMI